MVFIMRCTSRLTLLCACTCLALSGCSRSSVSDMVLAKDARFLEQTQSGQVLKRLPAPKNKIVVAVYEFQDQTGQHKSNDSVADFSRAVTQGGVSILKKALLDAGDHQWFTVLERGGLNNLLQERKIIRDTRQQYVGPDGQPLPDIPPLLYAGMLIEGGIISYETNTITGGAGARYLGIGGNTEYRQDIVTIYLRATNVQTGEVLTSVDASKTIYSTMVRGGVFKFVSFDELLEIETGFSVNEPPQFAARQAVEAAVYAMIMEGAQQGIWQFADEKAGKLALAAYQQRKNKERLDEDIQDTPVTAPSADNKTDADALEQDQEKPSSFWAWLPPSLVGSVGDAESTEQLAPYRMQKQPDVPNAQASRAEDFAKTRVRSDVQPAGTRYSEEVLRSYINNLSSWVWRKNRQTSESERLMGTTKVQIRLDRQGRLQDHWIISSSGSTVSDVIAMEMVRKAHPFPVIPADYYPERQFHEFVIQITGGN
ncbi:MAG: TonB family protein [Alphaproteobacteria bacterium]|nr:MAG: TonB family protein [Alphaproteobacteria bacterium]TAF14925.1 MAG: TonB family protein [Alphaproteobacteria bacterium]TAF41890.1 MAG: TonB family protein [Alphaproteobacteria bacterium]TAF77203.1 MAG: TonB family protein [Alphaproteobacteria bacterium]